MISYDIIGIYRYGFVYIYIYCVCIGMYMCPYIYSVVGPFQGLVSHTPLRAVVGSRGSSRSRSGNGRE